MSPSALAIRRITIDTQRAMEQGPENGLYWIPDENDITHGWAVVCGCEGTPYHGGAFCFEVRFPDNYPFDPPIFVYLTNDGRTRFNPNLYKNGKVCLSLLNTWQGEPWSGIQTVMSVLQSIQTAVLNEEPLVNEPAHPASKDSTHIEVAAYTRMVTHATIETAILGYMKDPPDFLVPIHTGWRARVMATRDALITKARELAAVWDGRTESVSFYNMAVRYRFGALADQMAALS